MREMMPPLPALSFSVRAEFAGVQTCTCCVASFEDYRNFGTGAFQVVLQLDELDLEEAQGGLINILVLGQLSHF